MMAVLRQAAKMRDVELSVDQIKGLLHVLTPLDPSSVLDALAGLWRDADTKAMPTPGQIRERVTRDARATVSRAELPADSWHTDAERVLIQATIDEWKAGKKL